MTSLQQIVPPDKDSFLPRPIWDYTVERVCCVIDFLVHYQWLLQMFLKVLAQLGRSLVDIPGRPQPRVLKDR